MAAPPSSRLQGMLQAAVQSVKWPYSLFWKICPQQGILIWGDGYYNGPIQTRKTVQPMEVRAEEASLQRSQQLRDLYDSLSAGETNQPQRRPCAALSPEDLTETEWFYLMCVSFLFPPGVGLPGKALARQHHLWLTGANKADSKTFARAILAKSARIQTVVCIPLLDGVVEFGSTDKVWENLSFINHVKTFFVDHHLPLPPKPALSEHSTSNPTSSYEPDPLADTGNQNEDDEVDRDNNDNDNEEEEDESDSEAKTGLDNIRQASNPNLLGPRSATVTVMAEPSEFDMAEDINLRGTPPFEDLSREDTHYSQTVTTILRCQPGTWADSWSTGCDGYLSQSAFSKWSAEADTVLHVPAEGTSQYLLKYILFSVPLLHSLCRDENSPMCLRDGGDGAATRFRKGTQVDERSTNHVLAERRRRGKLNERFIILRSLVPFVTKMDKASILGDTIEYVKQLRKKIQDLEVQNRQIDAKGRSSAGGDLHQSSSMKELRSMARATSVSDRGRTGQLGSDKRKLRIVEAGSGSGVKAKAVESPSPTETSVQVSIIESDALLELQCLNREGLLLDVMQMLRKLQIETTGVQSSLTNGFFVAELRAKVKENVNGKKASIVEVKRAIQQIIPHAD